MGNKKRILFISHSAGRNGATILLLHLIRWLKHNASYDCEMLVNGTGELLHDFRALAPTTVWRDPAFFLNGLPVRLRNAWKQRLRSAALFAKTARSSYDLIYGNTAAVWPQISPRIRRSKKVLWHIHELSYALRLSVGEDQIKQLFPLVSRFIVVSESVRNALHSDFSVAEERMDLVHEFTPHPQISVQNRNTRRLEILKSFGWPESCFLVMGCGGMGWRKGTDLFIQIAREASHSTARNIRFLWVGGESKGDEFLRFWHDVRALGLNERCITVPTTGNVADYYCAADVFALTSREDPFPLVMLEAGSFGIPTICFAGSGGGPEYVGDNAGFVVPYLNTIAFAEKIVCLANNSELTHRLGDSAFKKVNRQFTVDVQAPKILESINKTLNIS